jgi:hypothetical protein
VVEIFLFDIWKKGRKEISIEESIKNREKVCALLSSSFLCGQYTQCDFQTFLLAQQAAELAADTRWKLQGKKAEGKPFSHFCYIFIVFMF